VVQADDTDYSAFRAMANMTFNLRDIHSDYSEMLEIKKDDIAFLPQKLLM
jgi:hypothetical protein